MLYKARIEVHVVREQHYTTNLGKAFAVSARSITKRVVIKLGVEHIFHHSFKRNLKVIL